MGKSYLTYRRITLPKWYNHIAVKISTKQACKVLGIPYLSYRRSCQTNFLMKYSKSRGNNSSNIGTIILLYFLFFYILCFNATFSNISAISWRPVLVVEEAGVPRENHRPWTSKTGKLYHLRLRIECTLFCNLQSRARTHAVLVIGLYELLGNPTI